MLNEKSLEMGCDMVDDTFRVLPAKNGGVTHKFQTRVKRIGNSHLGNEVSLTKIKMFYMLIFIRL